MRTILVLLVGFWVVVGMIVTPLAYVMAVACAMLIGTDLLMRVQQSRTKRLNRRLGRWCNPVPLPVSRDKSVRAKARAERSYSQPGRQAQIRLVENKPTRGAVPGRSARPASVAPASSQRRESSSRPRSSKS